jgi:hypothetical protein
MMEMTQNKMHPGDVWNATQVFLGQNISIDAGDLYILNSALEWLDQIKDPKTKAVFKLILYIWALTVAINDSFSESEHGDIEKLMIDLC